jgi:hypothetical protein
VEPVASGDEIAHQLLFFAVLAEANCRLLAVKVVHADIVDLEEHLTSRGEPGTDQVLNDLVLRVNGDCTAAREFVEIDAMVASAESQLDSVVDEALPLQPLTDTHFNQQINRALLEQPRPDAFFNVLLAARLKDNGLDAL